ncbi:hypothetical protein [Cupriavidus sp. D384]|uniref:hypothetical protein n=1 Tax=Cupriavidus sp. D384 TaxID=1538095 RepID=UPI0012E71A4A|nr:hypothetical protein [Cupriavidus sp. D384]
MIDLPTDPSRDAMADGRTMPGWIDGWRDEHRGGGAARRSFDQRHDAMLDERGVATTGSYVRRHIIDRATDIKTQVSMHVEQRNRCVGASLFRRARATVGSTHARPAEALTRSSRDQSVAVAACVEQSHRSVIADVRAYAARCGCRMRLRVRACASESHYSCGFPVSVRQCEAVR